MNSNPLVSYMNRDFLDFYNAIRKDIPNRCPEWTDLSDSDFGIVLVQYFCGMADILSYYIDRAVNESFLETASERGSVIKLCKMLNYQLHQKYASTGTVLIALNKLNVDGVIPKYFLFSTVQDVTGKIIYFENQENFSTYASVFSVIKAYDYGNTDYTQNYYIEGNTGIDFTPQSSLTVNDFILFGHNHIWNNFNIQVVTPTTGLTGMWEYYSDGEWLECSNLVDETNGLFRSGAVRFDVPLLWEKTTLDGIEAYYLRYRILTGTTATSGMLSLCAINDLVFDFMNLKEGITTVGEILGSSDGTPNQSFDLDKTGYEEGSLIVEVDEGDGFIEWALTEEILNENSADRKYWIEVNAIDVVTINFGDNVHGKIPEIGTNNIRATYRICEGKLGNVGANTITVIKGSNSGISSVTNLDGFDGGDDREDIASARVNAPTGLVTNERAVTTEDYERLGRLIPGVKDIVAYADPDRWNDMWLYVLGVNTGGYPSDTLLSAVELYFQNKKQSGVTVISKRPTTVNINYALLVDIDEQYNKADTSAIVQLVFSEYASMENRSLNQWIYVSKIYEALEAIEGVNYVSVTLMYKEGDSAILNNVIEIDELEIADDLTVTWTFTGGAV